MNVEAIRRRIVQQARHRCGYCQTQDRVSGIPLTLEHIIPRVAGGGDEEENLWVSCRLCNELKGVQTEAIDPQTGRVTPLYNPRSQNWAEHCAAIRCSSFAVVFRSSVTPVSPSAPLPRRTAPAGPASR